MNEESFAFWFRFSHPFLKVKTWKIKYYSEGLLKSTLSLATPLSDLKVGKWWPGDVFVHNQYSLLT